MSHTSAAKCKPKGVYKFVEQEVLGNGPSRVLCFRAFGSYPPPVAALDMVTLFDDVRYQDKALVKYANLKGSLRIRVARQRR